MVRFRKRELVYVQEHFCRHDDAALAGALGVGVVDVVQLMKRHGLERSREERAWIKEHPNDVLPEYRASAVTTRRVGLAGLDCVVAALCALVVLGVYVPMLGPTVTRKTSGASITAAYTYAYDDAGNLVTKVVRLSSAYMNLRPVLF